MFLGNSITGKFNRYVLFMFLLIFPLFITTVSIISYREARSKAIDELRLSAAKLSVEIAHYFDTGFINIETMKKVFLAERQEQKTSRELVRKVFRTLLKDNPDFYAVWNMWEPNAYDGKDAQYAAQYGQSVGFFDCSQYRSGNEIMQENYGSDTAPAYVSDDNVDAYKEDYYAIPKKTKQRYITEPTVYSYSNKKEDERNLVGLISAIVGEDKFLGAIGIDVEFSAVDKLFASDSLYQNQLTALITGIGTIAYHSNTDFIGKPAKEVLSSLSDIETNINAHKEFIQTAISESSKKNAMRIFVPLDFSNGSEKSIAEQNNLIWTLMLEVPMSEIQKKTYRTLTIILVGGILGMTIFLIGIYFISKTITRPVLSIADIVDKIAHGNLQVQFSKEKNRTDEIGVLEENLMTMVNRLTTIVGSMKKNSRILKTAGDHFHLTSEQMLQGASEQYSSTEEVAASMEEMSASIAINSNNARETEKIAQAVAKNIQESSSSSEQAALAVRKISERIESIREIASQTNLLALNASIEAARAGMAGKGFAVVADEVNKLAAMSKNSAQEIIELAEDSANITEKAEKQMQEISPEIARVANLIHEVAVASMEQSVGVNSVNEAAQHLSQITQKNATSAEAIAKLSTEILSMATDLEELISFFRIEENN